MSRPEHLAPPEEFYNETEAKKYAGSSRMAEIQSQMSERALELLNLPDDGVPRYLLDIGCGSGLSGDVISDHGHYWCGIDISIHMLSVALEREVEGDVVLQDMGQQLCFRPGVFDGAISVSAIQWLCNADKTSHNPIKRMKTFFQSLFGCLSRGSRAVFQVYPETPKQMELITTTAMKCGFSGGLVVDYPNSTKAKKYFLCLFAGPQFGALPQGLDGDEAAEAAGISNIDRTRKSKRKRDDGKPAKKSREWIMKKKEQQRLIGKTEVRPDSKYTGRKRARRGL